MASPSVSCSVSVSLTDVERRVLDLFDVHARALRRYALALGVPAEEADDVVQDAFVALFHHLRDGRPDQNLTGWLFRVSYHGSLKRIVRARRQQIATADEFEALAVRASDPTPEQMLLDRERTSKLRAVARALPLRDRRCLYLRADGLSYRDIAHTLDISLGSVAKSLARAFSRLGRAEM